MGSFIQLLPDHIANQIAAGEVIQRPASVVKELMENAIDAGATKIEVLIKDAGRTSIQVIDNGRGMSESDALMCFERHATSKLHDAKDLFNLHTKGFRGEALASIAAIAHVTLNTKQADATTGTLIEIEGSQLKNNEPTVCADGTSFQIKNLFFNVPARRNFLKSDLVEYKHILSEFERLAIPHNNIHFVLAHNGKQQYNFPASNRKQRIVHFLSKGRDKEEKLVPVEETTDIVNISGFVCKPEFATKSRNEQYLFVNDRFFKSHHFHHAISKAFADLLKPDTHPAYYLFFEVDPTKLDVNVHPTKTEIKFEEDRLIYSILLPSVKNSLGKFNIMPSLDFEAEMGFEIPTEIKKSTPKEPVIQTNQGYNPFDSTRSKPANSSGSFSNGQSPAMRSAGFGQEDAFQWEEPISVEESVEAAQTSIQHHSTELQNKEWLIHAPYMVAKLDEQFAFVYYKRAYERVVYDELMEKFMLAPIASQGLLFPLDFQMNPREQAIWTENEKMLLQLGLKWTIENSALRLNAVPAILPEDKIDAFIEYLVHQMDFSTIEKGELAHHLVLGLSKTAAKQKQLISNNESANQLMEQLSHCADHNFSPSGLPIFKIVGFDQIEKI